MKAILGKEVETTLQAWRVNSYGGAFETGEEARISREKECYLVLRYILTT